MKKIFMLGTVLLILATNAFAFEAVGINFRNTISLSANYYNDTQMEQYPLHYAYSLKVNKKGIPLYAKMLFQGDYDSSLKEKYYFKTTVGYELSDHFDLFIERQDYNYKKKDDIVYRTGVSFNF